MDEPADNASNTGAPMPPDSPTPSIQPSRKRRWPLLIGIAAVVLIVVGLGSFFAASALEEHDSFCISCHTVPETTYYNRAYISLDNLQKPVTDLATAHYLLSKEHDKPEFACINCHRGDSSLGHRISTLALGGRDALIYVTGKEDATIEKVNTREGWLPNAACVSCHADTLLTLKGLDNHFHSHLPQAAIALAQGGKLIVPENLKSREAALLSTGLKTINTSLMCTDCHQAHTTIPGGSAVFFMDTDRRNNACVTCHKAAGEGPQDTKNLR